ncbi:MAG: ParA family protein [Bacteroidota bacterium]
MQTLSIAIQKGGSGKTTTAVNLAAALKARGKRVLLLDLDPQANLTQALGVEEEPEANIYQLLKQEAAGQEADPMAAVIETKSGLSLIPATLDLAMAEMELVSVYGRESLLERIVEPLETHFDYLMIDCPPAIGMLTVNALVASNWVLMPLQAEFLPLKGVQSFMKTFERIKKQLNEELQILGFVLTRYDRRKTMNREVLQKLHDEFGDKVFETRIRTNIALAGAQEAGVDIFSFSRRSNGALDYAALADELLTKLP